MGQVTLTILGKPLTFSSEIQGCMQGVNRGKPGVCPGTPRGANTVKKAVKVVAPKPATDDGGWLESLTPKNVQEKLEQRNPGVEIVVGQNSIGDLKLNLIRVISGRGQGKAEAAMKDLTDAADRLGLRITLTPEPLAGDKTTSKSRLTAWYKKHGFVENKGRNKDFQVSDGMYREPKK